MITIKSFVFNPFMENTYVLYNDSGEAVIIDPGCYDLREKEILKGFIAENNLQPVMLLNTHCHIDHVLGNEFVRQEFDVPLLMHRDEVETLRAVEAYAPSYGFVHYAPSEPDKFLDEGDLVEFGESILRVIFAPGHAPGHIAFYQEDQQFIIGGDVLFHRSIGRTDLPGGDMETLLSSIREKFYVLPDETVVYSGHGENTTIGEEKIHNPFTR